MKKWILFLCIAIASFSGWKIVQPKVTGVRAFTLEQDPNGNRALRMEIRIENPNAIGFKVTDPVFEIFLNSKRLGSGYSGEVIKVKARSEDFHGVYLATDIRSWKDALGPLLSILSTGKINFEIKGDLTAKVLFWKKTVKVEVSENVNILDLLK